MPSLFQLSFQKIGHFSFIVSILIGFALAECIFTIVFEITMKFLLHLFLPILFSLLLFDFLLDLLQYHSSFEVDDLVSLGAPVFLPSDHLVAEAFMQSVCFDDGHGLSVYIWFTNIMSVLLFFNFVIYILKSMSHMVQA